MNLPRLLKKLSCSHIENLLVRFLKLCVMRLPLNKQLLSFSLLRCECGTELTVFYLLLVVFVESYHE